MEICITLRQLRQRVPLIVWQSMTVRDGLPSRPQESREIPRIIRILPICRSIIQRIFLMHWIFRMNCRHFILRERYFMHSLEKSFRTGEQQQILSARLQKITSFLIIPCHRPIPFVRNMVIWQESRRSVLTAVR